MTWCEGLRTSMTQRAAYDGLSQSENSTKPGKSIAGGLTKSLLGSPGWGLLRARNSIGRMSGRLVDPIRWAFIQPHPAASRTGPC